MKNINLKNKKFLIFGTYDLSNNSKFQKDIDIN